MEALGAEVLSDKGDFHLTSLDRVERRSAALHNMGSIADGLGLASEQVAGQVFFYVLICMIRDSDTRGNSAVVY